MKNKKLTISILLTVAILICLNGFCQDDRIEKITLKVNAPFSTIILTVDRHSLNMHCEVMTESPQEQTPIADKKISSEQFETLEKLISANNFWGLSEKYTEYDVVDRNSYNVLVKTTFPKNGNSFYKVSCYGTCPNELNSIVQAIETLWDKPILEIGI